MSALAWGEFLGGAVQVYRTARIARQLRQALRVARAAANACSTCDPNDCKFLQEKIDGQINEIRKRAEDLVLDPSQGKMPYAPNSFTTLPRETIRGHELLLQEHQGKLRGYAYLYHESGCTQPLHPDVWRYMEMGVPKKGEWHRLFWMA